MEDDDEFGDLYTDVLQPFQMSSSSSAPPVESTPVAAPAAAAIGRSIDLNDRIPSDDEEILYGTKNSGDLKYDQKPGLNLNLNPELGGRVLGKVGETKGFEEEEVNYVDEVKGEELMNFGIEEGGEEEGEEDEFVIPGLSNSGVSSGRVAERKEEGGGGGSGGGDEWDDDSDSEDDLQIVLNDDGNGGGMMMGMGMGMEGLEEEDDEDGDNLVIVAGEGDVNLQGMEEMQDWGEDGGQGGEGGGERKGEGGDGKGDGGGMGTGAQKIGYGTGGHGYHPFHSQFKVSDNCDTCWIVG